MNKNMLAWGKSKLLELYIINTSNHELSFVIDSNAVDGETFYGLNVRNPSVLETFDPQNTEIVIFAVSNQTVVAILKSLNQYGFSLTKNVKLYSDLFYDNFQESLKFSLGISANSTFHQFVKSFSLISRVPIHTSILGNVLFLELLQNVSTKIGSSISIAEIGAYMGGNSLVALHSKLSKMENSYYIFDSFEGFPEITQHDPEKVSKGHYNIDDTFESILDYFSQFENTKIIRGFVPSTFSELKHDEKYGLVFYDCDLYQPALDTFHYFWNRIVAGGYMMVHDYFSEKGGFTGVEKATKEFFTDKNVEIVGFWQNTCAVIKKI